MPIRTKRIRQSAWVQWTVAQGLSGTLNRIIQKLVGNAGTSPADAGYATFVIGCVQTVVGALFSIIRRQSLRPTKTVLWGSLIFGFFSYVSGMLSFMTFQRGGEVGVATLLVTLSIIPGAVIDRLFFRYRLNMRQWAGVMLALAAGYFVLGQPSLAGIFRLPPWVWLALANGFSMAITQGISQAIKSGDAWVSNFWMGIPLAGFSSITVLVIAPLQPVTASALGKITMFGILYGLVMLAYIIFNLLAYREGAHIAIKKLVFNSTWLVTSVLAGILFFREPLTSGLLIGIICYCVGYWLLRNESGSERMRGMQVESPQEN